MYLHFRTALLVACISTFGYAQSDVAWAQAVEDEASAQQPPAPAAQPPAEIEQITVTARRREENLQVVPIAVTAFSADDLKQKGIPELRDLEFSTPGLSISPMTFRKNSLSLNIRGVAAGGDQLAIDPAIGLYFSEAAVSSPVGQNQSFYDIQNVQVLKGPQGTLFGRTSVAGAIVIEPRRPEGEFGGYARVGFGNYNRFTTEGAVNVPITEDLAVRVAFNRTFRDGWVTNLGANPDREDFDDKNSYAWRAGVRWDITENLSTYTVYDHYKHRTNGTPLILVAAGFPVILPRYGQIIDPPVGGLHQNGLALLPGYLDFVEAQAAAQQARGMSSFESNIDANAFPGRPPYEDARNWGITNQIEYQYGDLLFKNIMSIRHIHMTYIQDIDGTTDLPLGGGFSIPLLDGVRNFFTKQFTEEFQVQGSAFDDSVSWIAGAFHLRADGDDVGKFDSFGGQGINVNTPDNHSESLFGHISWQLSNSLTLDLGARRSWDTREMLYEHRSISGGELVCTYRIFLDEPAVCRRKRTAHYGGWSYNATLNYQPADDAIVYLTHRRGYRTGAFSSRAVDDPSGLWDKEKLQDVELGFKTDFELREVPVRLNAAVYNAWYDNRQTTIPKLICVFSTGCPPGNLQPVNSAENSGESILRGVEAELTVAPVPDLQLTANWSWTYERRTEFPDQTVNDVLGNPLIFYDNDHGELARTEDYTYSLGAVYRLPLNPDWGQVVASAHYYRQSTKDDNKGLYSQPSYGLFNYRIDWNNALGSDIGISFWMRNAGDQYYDSSAFALDSLGFTSIMPGDPREYAVEIFYEF